MRLGRSLVTTLSVGVDMNLKDIFSEQALSRAGLKREGWGGVIPPKGPGGGGGAPAVALQ